MRSLLKFCSVLTVVCLVKTQDDFADSIVCFDCFDKAENTSCGYIEPLTKTEDIELPKVQCKRGACVKWTFYRNHVLMMRRTCSLKVDLNIILNGVCRTERNGNGYLCMCSEDYCNSQNKIRSPFMLTLLVIAVSVVTLLT